MPEEPPSPTVSDEELCSGTPKTTHTHVVGHKVNASYEILCQATLSLTGKSGFAGSVEN